MAERLLQIVVSSEQYDELKDALDDLDQNIWWTTPCNGDEDRLVVSVRLHTSESQEVTDRIAETLEGQDGWHLVSLDIEASLPTPNEDEEERRARQETAASREEIYADVRGGAALTYDYLIMVTLATLVAAIGLTSSQVAVVIGAMVIAPLLGPIIAFAFGTALGNIDLLWISLRSLVAGIAVSVVAGIGLGLILESSPDNTMLDYSESLSLSTIVLPLASGAAAALMVASGQKSALVGVMVAAALLPPLAAFGLLVGQGNWISGFKAITTVGANIIAINLAAQVVFIFKGIRPRRWQLQDHKTSLRISVGISAALVVAMGAGFWLFNHEMLPFIQF